MKERVVVHMVHEIKNQIILIEFIGMKEPWQGMCNQRVKGVSNEITGYDVVPHFFFFFFKTDCVCYFSLTVT